LRERGIDIIRNNERRLRSGLFRADGWLWSRCLISYVSSVGITSGLAAAGFLVQVASVIIQEIPGYAIFRVGYPVRSDLSLIHPGE
jgi:hypothetical protein